MPTEGRGSHLPECPHGGNLLSPGHSGSPLRNVCTERILCSEEWNDSLSRPEHLYGGKPHHGHVTSACPGLPALILLTTAAPFGHLTATQGTSANRTVGTRIAEHLTATQEAFCPSVSATGASPAGRAEQPAPTGRVGPGTSE